MPQRTLAQRFWAKVDRRGPDECWPWAAATNQSGYGTLNVGGAPKRAHRIAWELHHGPIPAAQIICHHCDNPPCCNPAHLFLGTHADNAADRETKGRGRYDLTPRGEEHGEAKLTADQVVAIRAAYTGRYGEQSALARKYGVHKTTISMVVRGKTWAST